MALTTTGTEAELIAEYWNGIFQNELRANLLFDQYGMKSTHAKGSGTMVHWLALLDLSAAAALSEGQDPTEYTLSAGDMTATVAQYGASVLVAELLQDTWQAGSYQTLMERLARNAALTIDTIVRDSCFTAGGSAQYGGTAVARNSIATSGFDMEMAEIRTAVHSMEALKVPTFPDGFYHGILHQDIKYDLQSDTAHWQEILKYTESGLGGLRKGVGTTPGQGGFVGSMYGTKFILSQQALKMVGSGSPYTGGSAGTDIYQTYIFGPEHFGVSELQDVQIIVKNPHPASDLDLYGSVGWKAAFVAQQLNSSRMTRLETGSTFGN